MNVLTAVKLVIRIYAHCIKN